MFAVITAAKQKGYSCTESSPDLKPSIIRELELNALPHGGNWPDFIGARSIKGFRLSNNSMAMCYSKITSGFDDVGRAGVLLCHCVILDVANYSSLIQQRDFAFDLVFNQYKSVVKNFSTLFPAIKANSSSTKFESLKLHYKLITKGRIILRENYENPEQWRKIENEIRNLLSMLSISQLPQFGFTSLTLSESDPSKFLGLPKR